MPLLFSYGTLQQEDVQRSTFGRLLDGQPDALAGFEKSSLRIDDPQAVAAYGTVDHVNAIPNGKPGSRVTGTVFEVTDAELSVADRYESVARYSRLSVTLASGRQAWVYAHAPSEHRERHP
jgi:gamma-glutamylcyclotransferase (GGCT)/AIG2-like uncharacterized protein YtfP